MRIALYKNILYKKPRVSYVKFYIDLYESMEIRVLKRPTYSAISTNGVRRAIN